MFSRILLPTDFSDCSVEAARVARRLADRFDSRVRILHVLDEPLVLDPMVRGDVPVDLIRSRMERFARDGLESFVASHFAGAGNVATMLAAGIPHKEIVKAARETGADLIVIGTHGRTGVEHVLFGSTAEKVVRMAPCPVLTVRPGGSAFLEP